MVLVQQEGDDMFEKKGSIEIADYVYKPSYKNYRDMDVIICIEHEGYWNEEKYLEFRFSRK